MPEVKEMAPPETGELEQEKSGKKSGKKSKISLNLIIIIVAQLVFAGAGFFIVSKVIKPDPALQQLLADERARIEQQKAEEEAEGEHAVADVPKEIKLIEDVIVNPAGTRGSRYLSISVGVELNAAGEESGGHGEASAGAFDMKKPMLRDALINILSSKTIPQLTDIAEKETMRTEIQAKFAEILNPETVHQIYFVDFVLQ